MNKKFIGITLAVQVTVIGLFSAFSGNDSEAAYPMEAGYVVRDQNVQVVYYDGTPAELTYEKMDSTIQKAHTTSGVPTYIKRVKNLKCERRDMEGESAYRCALNVKKLATSGI